MASTRMTRSVSRSPFGWDRKLETLTRRGSIRFERWSSSSSLLLFLPLVDANLLDEYNRQEETAVVEQEKGNKRRRSIFVFLINSLCFSIGLVFSGY